MGKKNILVIIDEGKRWNGYGPYVCEILRMVGLNNFRLVDLSQVDSDLLESFPIVLLTRCILSKHEADILKGYVEAGGTIIAFQPDWKLAEGLGLKGTYTVTIDRYFRIEETSSLGPDIKGESLQLHGVANNYYAGKGEVLGWLCNEPDRNSPYPAIVKLDCGVGHALIFTFDLPKNVALTRQGNPTLADMKTNGDSCDKIRPSDAFVGHIDPAVALIPQADVLCFILRDAIQTAKGEIPLPFFWQFPGTSQSVLIMTSDDDWSKPHEFEQLISAVEEAGSHLTLFLVDETSVTKEAASGWIKKGHSLGIHPDIRDPLALNDRKRVSDCFEIFKKKFGFVPKTGRNHCIAWSGHIEMAKILARNGLKMDFNYVSFWPAPAGYMAGSGLPMKFVGEDGDIADIFQQPAHFSEDIQISDFDFSQRLTTDEASARSAEMIEEACSLYHTAICLNSHPVSFATYSSTFVRNTLATANRLGVPILSADEWLSFVEGRYSAETSDVSFTGGILTFFVDAPQKTDGLTVLTADEVPGGQKARKVLVGGQEVTIQTVEINGRKLVATPVPTGTEEPVRIEVTYNDT